ncbi:MAG: hypothetical protein JXQ83_05985 [Candidatus Glassbacteria bacterium]|nr:hypothetical protein [Candidatus Glassbacteria bacterium]
MAGKKTKLKPPVLIILLDRLRCGYTREGACGAAGISASTLRRWEREFPELAGEIELAILQGIARDEEMLDEHIVKGDRVALLHRMKSRDGPGRPEAGEQVESGKENRWSRQYQQVVEAIERLTPEQRREAVRAYREARESGGKDPGLGQA